MNLLSLLLVLHILLGVYPSPEKAEAQITIIPTTKQISVITTPTDNKLTILNEIVTPTPTVVSTPKIVAVAEKKVKVESLTVWSTNDVLKRIYEVFGPNALKAEKVARCESGLRSDAVGDRNLTPSSYGVFQIRAFKGRGSPTQLLDPEYNIQFAYKMSGGGQNWAAWTCGKKVGV